MVLSTLAEVHQINMCTALKELCHSVDRPVAAPIQLATRTVSKTHNFHPQSFSQCTFPKHSGSAVGRLTAVPGS